MEYEITEVAPPVKLGSGPHWDAKEKCLYFVSIVEHTIHKYVPATKTETKTKLSGNVGFIIPISDTDDRFVVGLNRQLLAIRWDGKNDSKVEILRKIAEVDTEADLLTNRLNDGKADPMGRLFAGTMGREHPPGKFELNKGSLYMFDDNGAHKCADIKQVSLSGGLCWDKKINKMYYIDSLKYNIRSYDYDMNTGVMSNEDIVYRLSEVDERILPAGMTIDTDGNLWVACFEGYKIIQIDVKSKEIIKTVKMSVSEVTSLAFGGENLDELYVTTGKTQDALQPKSGAVFKVTGLGVKGFAGESCKFTL